jgi:hypothetical protein
MGIFGLPSWIGAWEVFFAFFPLVILIVPWVFFLLNLRGLLWQVHPQNRAMPAEQVWLNLIPVFGLGWFIYTVVKIKESVERELRSRSGPTRTDLGYNLGLAAGILGICLVFVWWVPFVGWAVGIAWLVCWIGYWLRTSEITRQLQAGTRWAPGGAWPPAGAPSPWQPSPPSAANSGGAYGSPGSNAPPRGNVPPRENTSPAGPGLPQERQCAMCGTVVAPGDQFCRRCGLRLPW